MSSLYDTLVPDVRICIVHGMVTSFSSPWTVPTKNSVLSSLEDCSCSMLLTDLD